MFSKNQRILIESFEMADIEGIKFLNGTKELREFIERVKLKYYSKTKTKKEMEKIFPDSSVRRTIQSLTNNSTYYDVEHSILYMSSFEYGEKEAKGFYSLDKNREYLIMFLESKGYKRKESASSKEKGILEALSEIKNT